MEECQKEYRDNGKLLYEQYLKGKERHRDNLPAMIAYYKNGKIHSEYYYKEGKVHREGGPAKIFYYKNGKIRCEFYFLDGIEYTDEDIIDSWKEFCKMQIFR